MGRFGRVAERQDSAADEAAESAFALEPGVPYVPGWSEADEAARLLAAELAACGLAGQVPYLHPDVTVAGAGVVELGALRRPPRGGWPNCWLPPA